MEEPDRRLARRLAMRSIAASVAAGWVAPCYPQASQEASDSKARQVNYRTPPRDYVHVPVGPRSVQVEKTLQSEDRALARKAVDRLARNINRALRLLPEHAPFGLRNTRYYLMHGPKAPGGGKDNGLEYIHPLNASARQDLDPRWGDSIVVYSAENYDRISDLWALKAVIHELAHAYHLHDWPEDQPEILHPYQAAMKRGLYHKVEDLDGKVLDAAYATTNPLEYFAELTCMYFSGCNYRPFDRSDLKRYDPDGYAMVERFWRVGKGASGKAPAKMSKRSRR